jgi:predicted DNA-binding protein
MEEHRERVTLCVDAKTKRRLKAAAAAKGVSVSMYCRAAIEGELARDAGEAGGKQDAALAMFEATRQKYRSAKPTSKTAVDYIREGREIRDRQMDAWLYPDKNSSS